MEELDVLPTTLEEKSKAIEKVSSKTIVRFFKFSWLYRYYGRPLLTTPRNFGVVWVVDLTCPSLAVNVFIQTSSSPVSIRIIRHLGLFILPTKLKMHNSAGVHNVPCSLLKHCKKIIATSLALIFKNKSANWGVLQQESRQNIMPMLQVMQKRIKNFFWKHLIFYQNLNQSTIG